MQNSSAAAWASCLQRRPAAKLRVFCFPYAGAGAAAFRPWTALFPASVELWGVQLPGRERRIGEPAIPSIAGIAQQALPALRSVLDPPFAFFGHSMGALLAFELSRLLGGSGPACLIVSGCGAPHLPRLRGPLAHLPDEQFAGEVQRMGGTADGVLDNPELRSLFLPLLRADFHAVESYFANPEPPLTCPVFAYGGLADREVPHDHLLGWGAYTSASFAVRMFPGDHFFLNSQRPGLTARVAQDLTLAGLI